MTSAPSSSIDFSAFRNPTLVRELIVHIHKMAGERPITLMEFCGTHTVSIGRYGFRSMMPSGIRLLSGPGCPVCVTVNHDIDHAIALARMENVTITTFGDMMRVPGSSASLAALKAQGHDIRMVYSPLDALELAQAHPDRELVFLGVGFETTTPTIAACILEAAERDLKNFSVLCAHKLTPPAIRAIAADPATAIDGFILPGHVSTITGVEPYRFLSDDFGLPGVVTGFEPVDILEGIAELVRMITSGTPHIANAYRRGVERAGNAVARAVVDRVFEPVDATWRGLGVIPQSGLKIRPDFARFDAALRFQVAVEPTVEPKGCRCGDVLRGRIFPNACPLFGKACTPEHAIGPCMVSSEGSCAAYYRYREPAHAPTHHHTPCCSPSSLPDRP
ncbi:hydrogenase formation protein HypD [Collinsella sp. AGMB00827]|uniref:Hydrogenase formation protein HypD n=2 Tax=Collinsella ureilytica TaxID=2869515 RepID=A0ABS7MJU8_9ACTN|nr:hydrogenase formation protein HypD [Collinsella urealyticum]